MKTLEFEGEHIRCVRTPGDVLLWQLLDGPWGGMSHLSAAQCLATYHIGLGCCSSFPRTVASKELGRYLGGCMGTCAGQLSCAGSHGATEDTARGTCAGRLSRAGARGVTKGTAMGTCAGTCPVQGPIANP